MPPHLQSMLLSILKSGQLFGKVTGWGYICLLNSKLNNYEGVIVSGHGSSPI